MTEPREIYKRINYSGAVDVFINIKVHTYADGNILTHNGKINLAGFDLGDDNEAGNILEFDELINVPVHVGFIVSNDGAGQKCMEIRSIMLGDRYTGKTVQIKQSLSDREMSRVEEACWKHFENQALGGIIYGDES